MAGWVTAWSANPRWNRYDRSRTKSASRRGRFEDGSSTRMQPKQHALLFPGQVAPDLVFWQEGRRTARSARPIRTKASDLPVARLETEGAERVSALACEQN